MKNGKSEVMVSILCCVYNHEPYLRQCLDGFVSQKTTFPFEAIIHDDLSTDGSAAIIKEYAEKYPDIIKPYFEKENQFSKHDGSLFKIIYPLCKGKYTAMCEGDDYWTDPLKLQKQVDIMENDPSLAFCFHRCKSTSGANVYPDEPPSNRLTAKHIILHHYIPTASLLYRTELMDDVDDFNLTIGDIPMEIQLAMQGDVYFIDEYMSVYRNDNNNSLTHNREHRKKSINVRVKLYYKLLKKYKFKRYSIYLLYSLVHSIAQLPLIVRNVYLRK